MVLVEYAFESVLSDSEDDRYRCPTCIGQHRLSCAGIKSLRFYLLIPPGAWQAGKNVLDTILLACPLVALALGRK